MPFSFASLIVWSLLVMAPPSHEEIQKRIQSVSTRLDQTNNPILRSDPQMLSHVLAQTLRDIEWIRSQSVNVFRGKYFSHWEGLERRWVAVLQKAQTEHGFNHQLTLEVLRRSEVGTETRDRIARQADFIPVHPDTIAKFWVQSKTAIRLNHSDLHDQEFRKGVVADTTRIWISIPAIDFEDGIHRNMPLHHSLHGFENDALVPDFSGFDDLEIWALKKDGTSLLIKMDRQMLTRVARRRPQSMLEWLNLANQEYRLNYFSPGEHIIKKIDGKVEVVRWESPFNIDDLVDESQPLDPMVWFAFQKGPRFHFEPRSVYDPLPRLYERGGFSVLDKAKAGSPALVFFPTAVDYKEFSDSLEYPPAKVGALLLGAYAAEPKKFANCGEYLRRFKLIP